MRDFTCGLATAIVLLAAPMSTARADATADFYARTTLTFYVGAGVAGGFDTYSRALMEYMPRHIPGNPTVVVKNMAGAGGVSAANYLFNVAPKDGATIGMPLSTIVISEVLTPKNVKYRSQGFGWIGTVATMTELLGVRSDSGVATIDDARKKPLVIGSTSKLSQAHLQPALVKALLGTQFRIVDGYKTSTDVTLAMERGEVQGRTNPWDTWNLRPDLIKAGQIRFLVQFGPKIPELANVPGFSELVKTPQERALVDFMELIQYIGRSVAAPPGIPNDRLAALRKSFDDTLADPQFIARMKSRNLDLNPRTGAALQSNIEGIMVSAPETARALKTALDLK